MTPLRRPLSCLLPLLCLAAVPVQAEKADRSKPMTLESDKPCVVNLLKQTSVCSGNVVISQGTLLIRADKLEMRETADGYQVAVATGTAGQPAQGRQRRDGTGEFVEGQAQRIEYDSRNASLRFEGQAVVRRLQGGQLVQETQGSVIVWDGSAELFTVQGGVATASNPDGRQRTVFVPRQQPDAASGAASAPALKGSPTLGERR